MCREALLVRVQRGHVQACGFAARGVVQRRLHARAVDRRKTVHEGQPLRPVQPQQGIGRRVAAYHPAIQVQRQHAVGVMLEQRAETLLALAQPGECLGVLDGHTGQRRQRVDAAHLRGGRIVRRVVVHRERAQHRAIAGQYRRRPARAQVVRQGQRGVIAPQRIGGDVGHHHALAAPRRGAAGAGRRTDRGAVDAVAETSRQPGRGTVVQAAVAQQQDRAGRVVVRRFVRGHD